MIKKYYFMKERKFKMSSCPCLWLISMKCWLPNCALLTSVAEGRMTQNDDLRWVFTDMVAASFILSQIFIAGAEETLQKPQSEYPVSLSRMEPRTSLIRSMSANLPATMLVIFRALNCYVTVCHLIEQWFLLCDYLVREFRVSDHVCHRHINGNHWLLNCFKRKKQGRLEKILFYK
jgi:hypothetical protein